jgi:CRISPR system Cascade subunit CasB
MTEPDFGIVLSWWKSLENDRGGRAQLRRAANATEVVFSPAYHRLYNEVSSVDVDKEALALVAGVCAHVKNNDDSMPFTRQMAEGDKPKVSGLRFRRLLAINDRGELYHAMIRIIGLLGGTVSIRDLAKTIYWWNEKTKKRLAYDYYAEAKGE